MLYFLRPHFFIFKTKTMISRILFALFITASLLSMNACNDSSQSKDDNTGDTSSPPVANTPAPASTIVTTPQHMLVVRMKVANYAKWKPTYDERDSARLASGLHSYVIGRGLQDSNTIIVALKADDTARAMAYTKDPALKAAMQKGGLIGTPKTDLMTLTWQDTAMISTPLRSVVMFTVKDWETWKTHFESGNQQRIDNGLMVRNYGHVAGDNHKVRVVTALIDSAKAVAYFKSDELKKRRQESGVTGEPERFLFRIVQRY